MMEFALSKLNMLIFVTAIAAIVLFFMNTVSSNFRTRQSYELTYKVGESIKSGIESSSYCNVKYVSIPNKIKINSGDSYYNNSKYILNISNFSGDDGNKLIISILDHKKKNIFAAYDIDYNGVVKFYDWKYNEDNDGKYNFQEVSDGEYYYLDFDTLKKDSIDNRITIAKKVINTVPHIYIFSCGYKNNIPGCAQINSDFTDTLVDDQNISCMCAIPELSKDSATCNT